MGLAAVPCSVNFPVALELGPRDKAEVSGLSGAADISSPAKPALICCEKALQGAILLFRSVWSFNIYFLASVF